MLLVAINEYGVRLRFPVVAVVHRDLKLSVNALFGRCEVAERAGQQRGATDAPGGFRNTTRPVDLAAGPDQIKRHVRESDVPQVVPLSRGHGELDGELRTRIGIVACIPGSAQVPAVVLEQFAIHGLVVVSELKICDVDLCRSMRRHWHCDETGDCQRRRGGQSKQALPPPRKCLATVYSRQIRCCQKHASSP